MFTGLFEEVGITGAIANGPAGRELYIRAAYTGLVDGESIAVNGVCLTVREHDDDGFTVGAVETTLERTTIGDWLVGRRVNLERAMALGERLGGHLVSGHVDATGIVRSVGQSGDARLVALALPPEVMELSVLHGSISVDGGQPDDQRPAARRVPAAVADRLHASPHDARRAPCGRRRQRGGGPDV
jgi:riboflavin synthase